jgi:hypothetical protein
LKIEQNQRDQSVEASIDHKAIERRVLQFLQLEAGFAQVYTINRDGFPVGRTLVAPVQEDWSVILVQRNVHRRLRQLERDPHVEITWVGEPAESSVNDQPHVYDFGLLIPRVVFLRGLAEFMSEEETVEAFNAQTSIQISKGLTKAPERTTTNVRTELVGVRIRPVQIRAEGFGDGAQSFTWRFGEAE